VVLTFCSSHYEAPSTSLCATDFLYLSIWSSFHSSLCNCHSVPVIINLLPVLCATDILYLSLYIPSTAHSSNDILYLSLCRSFHSCLCYSQSLPVLMKLLPQLCVLHSNCTCHYVAPSINTCGSDLLYLSIWSSFHISGCYWHSVPSIMKLFPKLSEQLIFRIWHYVSHSTVLFATCILYLSFWCSFQSSLCYWHSVLVIMKILPQLRVLLAFYTCH